MQYIKDCEIKITKLILVLLTCKLSNAKKKGMTMPYSQTIKPHLLLREKIWLQKKYHAEIIFGKAFL